MSLVKHAAKRLKLWQVAGVRAGIQGRKLNGKNKQKVLRRKEVQRLANSSTGRRPSSPRAY
jgi:hypothetical protein